MQLINQGKEKKTKVLNFSIESEEEKKHKHEEEMRKKTKAITDQFQRNLYETNLANMKPSSPCIIQVFFII